MGLGIEIPSHQGFQTDLAVPINLLLTPVCLRPRSLQQAQPAGEAEGLQGRVLSSGSGAGARGTRVLAASGWEGAASSSWVMACREMGQQLWHTGSPSSWGTHGCNQLSRSPRAQPSRELSAPVTGSVFCKASCCETSLWAAI